MANEEDDIEEFLKSLRVEQIRPPPEEEGSSQKSKQSGFQFGAAPDKPPPPKLTNNDSIAVPEVPIQSVFGFNVKTVKDVKSLTHGKRFVQLSHISSLGGKKKDIPGDWVTAGVVVSKKVIPAKDARKSFTIWNLCNMQEMNKSASLLIFNDVPNVDIGTTIALLNPIITASKSKEDLCSLKLDHPLKLLILGPCVNFGRCIAITKGGTPCTSFINKSHNPHCVFHINMEYKAIASMRPELKATYCGIQPKTKSATVQEETKSNVALLGPQTNKSMKAAAKKALEAAESAKKEHFELKRQMEQQMISDALKNPLSLAARNLARATGSKIPANLEAKSKVVDKRIDLSKFSNARDVFKQQKPRLGRGLNPSDFVFESKTVPKKKENIKRELAQIRKLVESIQEKSEKEKVKQEKEEEKDVKLPNKRPARVCEDTEGSKSERKKRKLEEIQSRLKSKMASLTSNDEYIFDLN